MYLKPYAFLKTIASSSVRERLTTANLMVPAVLITAEVSNTGRIYIGDNQVSSTRYGADLGAGDSITLSAVELGWADAKMALKDIWLIPSVATDGVSAMFLERAE